MIGFGRRNDDLGADGEARGGDEAVDLDGLSGWVEDDQLDLRRDEHCVGGSGSLL